MSGRMKLPTASALAEVRSRTHFKVVGWHRPRQAAVRLKASTLGFFGVSNSLRDPL